MLQSGWPKVSIKCPILAYRHSQRSFSFARITGGSHSFGAGRKRQTWTLTVFKNLITTRYLRRLFGQPNSDTVILLQSCAAMSRAVSGVAALGMSTTAEPWFRGHASGFWTKKILSRRFYQAGEYSITLGSVSQSATSSRPVLKKAPKP